MTDYKDLLATFNLVNPVHNRVKAQDSGLRQKDNELQIHGVIFTDTVKLSSKFAINQGYVLAAINNYIERCETLGTSYVLCDMADAENAVFIQYDQSWHSYHLALYSYCSRNSIKMNSSISVFIIGGDDVIAIPQKFDAISYKKIYNYNIDVDFRYCFKTDFDIDKYFEVVHNNYTAEVIEQRIINQALCNVSRLPLSYGKQTKSFDKTIGNYFDRVISSQMKMEIDRGTVSVSQDFLPHAIVMSKGVPQLPIKNNPYFVYEGMYVSPTLAVNNEESMKVYIDSLHKADFLWVLLHGSNQEDESGYYGVDGSLAFNIPLLNHCKSKIFNSLACYGARYKQYKNESSMLLSAIYSSFLSFTGASDISWGGVSGDLVTCAPRMMRLYTQNILSGQTLGEALLYSKIRYYVQEMLECYRNNYSEDMQFPAYTVYEYNLFGDPQIKCNVTMEENTTTLPKGEDATIDTPSASLDEIYERVHNLVDEGLNEIQVKLEHYLLSDLGIKDAKLASVDKIKSSSSICYDFTFTYTVVDDMLINLRTDAEGNIIKIFGSL